MKHEVKAMTRSKIICLCGWNSILDDPMVIKHQGQDRLLDDYNNHLFHATNGKGYKMPQDASGGRQ